MTTRHGKSPLSLRHLSRSALFLGLLATAGTTSLSRADIYTWTGASTNANFSDPTAWTPNGTPGAADTVNITGSGFGTTLNVRNTDNTNPGTWTVENWNYNTGTGLSVLGRGPANMTVGLAITGTLTKQGSGTLAFRDQAATRKLSVTLNTLDMQSGILFFGSSSDVLTALDITTANISGGTLSLRTINESTANISTINFTDGGTLDLHGTGSAEHTTLTTTSITSTGSAGIITTAAANTATLRIISTPATTSSYGGTITGVGTSLEKQGAGTQILSGANTYGGGTTISEGTLLINNTAGASGTGTANVIIKTGGTLGGTGFIGGSVITQSGGVTSELNGHLAPGSNGAGTLTIQNTLTLAAYTRLDYQLNSANVAPGTGGNDLIAVVGTSGTNGDITLGANIVLNLTSLGANFGPGTYDLITFTGTLTGAENLSTWTATGLSQSYSFGSDADSVFVVVTAVPEPSTTALILGAAGSMIYLFRRKK